MKLSADKIHTRWAPEYVGSSPTVATKILNIMTHKLEKELMDWLTDKTNRSPHQTQFLFDLLDGDYEKLLALELQLANCMVNYCPGDLEAVEEVMKMTPKVKLLDYEF
jgi:hypothetical protein